MFIAVFTATMVAATGYKLVSPNGRLVSEINVGDSLTSVSYTHLTLPTIRLV